MGLTVALAGHSLREFGPHSPVTFTTTERGSGVLSWRMDPGRHHSLHSLVGTPVFASAGGCPVWSGIFDEPAADGQYRAVGLPVLADAEPAIDGPGLPTANIQSAVNVARIRGALLGWQAAEPLGEWPGEVTDSWTIAQLLDAVAADAGQRWRVDARGHLTFYHGTPGSPDWHVSLPGYRYGWTSEGLVTHLTGHYMAGIGVYASVTVATGVLGARRGEAVDLTDRGLLSEAEAVERLTGLAVSQGKAMPAATERIEIGPGALLAPGFTPQPSWRIAGGDTLRIWGASDGRSGAGYLDLRVAGTDYDDATGVCVVSPANLAPRGFVTALEDALSA